LTKSLISFLLLFFLSTALQALDKECEAEIKAAVENEYKKEYKTILITSSKVEAATRENLSGFRYVALELQRRNLQRDNGIVLVILEDSNKISKRVFVRYKIDALMEIIKAKYNLQKDKIISSDELLTQSAPFKNYYSRPVAKDSIVGMSSKRFIPAGSIIYEKDIQRPPLVKKNSTSYATMDMEGIEIGLEVVSLEDGNSGETINVKSKNGKIMKALVRENGSLLIR